MPVFFHVQPNIMQLSSSIWPSLIFRCQQQWGDEGSIWLAITTCQSVTSFLKRHPRQCMSLTVKVRRQWFYSTLVLVMAWCLTAPSHYRNQPTSRQNTIEHITLKYNLVIIILTYQKWSIINDDYFFLETNKSMLRRIICQQWIGRYPGPLFTKR